MTKLKTVTASACRLSAIAAMAVILPGATALAAAAREAAGVVAGDPYRPLSFQRQGSSCSHYYRTKKGDSCFSILQDSGLTAAQLGELNANIDNSVCNGELKPGMWLCLGAEPGQQQPPPSDVGTGVVGTAKDDDLKATDTTVTIHVTQSVALTGATSSPVAVPNVTAATQNPSASPDSTARKVSSVPATTAGGPPSASAVSKSGFRASPLRVRVPASVASTWDAASTPISKRNVPVPVAAIKNASVTAAQQNGSSTSTVAATASSSRPVTIIYVTRKKNASSLSVTLMSSTKPPAASGRVTVLVSTITTTSTISDGLEKQKTAAPIISALNLTRAFKIATTTSYVYSPAAISARRHHGEQPQIPAAFNRDSRPSAAAATATAKMSARGPETDAVLSHPDSKTFTRAQVRACAPRVADADHCLDHFDRNRRLVVKTAAVEVKPPQPETTVAVEAVGAKTEEAGGEVKDGDGNGTAVVEA